ncbi:hypothetical protein [Mucilaginibacter pineti]|uniref:hypothetical protein n=1 Tax=Mucilaginibacter pineti TaxID=1391627 RepID=UPI0013BEA520|nr:hypothetical protein [Mucilaginibacter pineti]
MPVLTPARELLTELLTNVNLPYSSVAAGREFIIEKDPSEADRSFSGSRGWLILKIKMN